MNKSAIVVASAAEERRSIAQFLKPTGFFSALHTSGTYEEVAFLLGNTRVDILFCDLSLNENESYKLAAKLTSLAADYDIELVFFSHLDPLELPLLGLLPPSSNCLGYDASPVSATAMIKKLLQSTESKGKTENFPGNKQLIDQGSGIYSRFYFDTFLDQELSRSKLTGRPFSLLLIEPRAEPTMLSKQPWGAELPSVVETIRDQVRTSDLLCRIENQRLALLLPETNSSNAERVINRILSNIQNKSGAASISLKFGLASPSLANHYNRHGLLCEAEASL